MVVWTLDYHLNTRQYVIYSEDSLIQMSTTVGIWNTTIWNPETFVIRTFLRSYFKWLGFSYGCSHNYSKTGPRSRQVEISHCIGRYTIHVTPCHFSSRSTFIELYDILSGFHKVAAFSQKQGDWTIQNPNSGPLFIYHTVFLTKIRFLLDGWF